MSTWKKYLLVSALLFALILPTPSGQASPVAFSDVANSYAKEQISKLQASGVIVGDSDGKFHPKRAVTRGEFVTLLGRALAIQPLQSDIPAFRDVPPSAWYYGWVQAGVTLQLINGTSEHTFSPSTYINRQEVAALLVRAFNNDNQLPANASYRDAAQSAKWALPYIAKATELGLMQGDQGYFRPTAQLTREEAAVVLERIYSRYQQVRPSPEPIQLGWQYLSTTQEFTRRVANSPINTLSPRWFFLQSSGSLSDAGDPSLVSWAHEHGKQVWPLVGNRFDPDATHLVLSQPEKRKQHVQEIVKLAKKYKVDGINIDYEAMYPHDRDHFSLFIAELAAALKREQIVLSVDVPPDSQSEWSAPFDYAALGKSADYLVLMAYDQHWSSSPRAGSVASLAWVEQGIKKLIKEVPANKVIVGMPLYTRDWYSQQGKVISTDMTIPLSLETIKNNSANVSWKESLGQYEASYRRNGTTHQIWLEESRSLGRKYLTALQLGTAGGAYWYVDDVNEDIWNSIRNAKRYYDVISQ